MADHLLNRQGVVVYPMDATIDCTPREPAEVFPATALDSLVGVLVTDQTNQSAPFGWLWLVADGRENRPATREELIASHESNIRTSSGYGIFKLPDGRDAFVIEGSDD